MDYLVSIIVPIYNCESYLNKCVNSLINQTYKNLEIILIDDGSKDNSLKLCKEYSSKDERIIVIHKENGGVSTARNMGLDNAHGQYITFVDSDDWLKYDTIEYLLNESMKNNSEITICDCVNVTGEKVKIQEKYKDNFIMENGEGIQAILYRKYCSVWGQLFKREVIDNIRFNETLSNNEDTLFLINVYNRANRIFQSKEIKYNYNVQSANSLTKLKSKKLILDQLKARDYIYDFIKQNNINEEKFNYYNFCTCYNVLMDLFSQNLYNEPKAKECISNIKKLYLKVFKDKNINRTIKMKAILLIVCPKLLVFMKKVKRGNL